MSEATQPIGQGEALEARARELLAAEYDKLGLSVDSRVMRHGGPFVDSEGAALRAITAALQPHIDHAVGGVRDAIIDLLKRIDDGEFASLDDRADAILAALATPPLVNTVGLDAGTVERCAQVAEASATAARKRRDSYAIGSALWLEWDGRRARSDDIATTIRALTSGDRS